MNAKTILPTVLEKIVAETIEAKAAGGNWTDESIARRAARLAYEAGRDDEAKALGNLTDAWFACEIREHARTDYAAWCSYFRPIMAARLK